MENCHEKINNVVQQQKQTVQQHASRKCNIQFITLQVLLVTRLICALVFCWFIINGIEVHQQKHFATLFLFVRNIPASLTRIFITKR